MENRKNQLQQQIIEALKAKDNDLFSLLKSQWAHRFGVESLEELKNLDLTLLNENNQKNDQSEDYVLEVDREIPIKDDDNKEKEIPTKDFDNKEKGISIEDDNNKIKDKKNDNEKFDMSVKVENKESSEIKSYSLVDSCNQVNKSINQFKENKISQKIEALIPLPPKPKYSYLNKWLLRS